MVRFVVLTTSRARDVNGNSYYRSTVISTATRKSLAIEDTGGERNASSLVAQLLRLGAAESCDAILDLDGGTISAREYDRRARAERTPLYPHEVTAETLLSLEKEYVPCLCEAREKLATAERWERENDYDYSEPWPFDSYFEHCRQENEP